MTKKTIAGLMATVVANADQLVPMDRDPAFTLFHGVLWEGVLRNIPWNPTKLYGGWVIVPPAGETTFPHHEGGYKFFPLEMANIGVYAPDEGRMREVEDDDYNPAKYGMMVPSSPEKKTYVRFDIMRRAWYLRAFED